MDKDLIDENESRVFDEMSIVSRKIGRVEVDSKRGWIRRTPKIECMNRCRDVIGCAALRDKALAFTDQGVKPQVQIDGGEAVEGAVLKGKGFPEGVENINSDLGNPKKPQTLVRNDRQHCLGMWLSGKMLALMLKALGSNPSMCF